MGRSYVVCIGSKDAVNFNALPMRCCSKFAQARYLLRPLSPHALAFFGNTYPIVQGIPLVNGEVLPLGDFWILNCCLTPSSRIQHTLRSEFTLVFRKTWPLPSETGCCGYELVIRSTNVVPDSLRT